MKEKEDRGGCAIKTSVGGQALMEGVMMRGPKRSAMAVRRPDQTIAVEEWNTKQSKGIRKLPFFRGIFSLIDSLSTGYKCLMRSAELSGEEEEPSKFEIWIEKKFGKSAETVFETAVTIVAVGVCLLLFMVIPSGIASLLQQHIKSDFTLTLIEGVLKILIFFGYIAAISKMKEIRRTFMYHGAEHKTIACYEAGEELTVENIRKYTRLHPRCGTSFLILVLLISILVFSLVTWESLLVRVLLKLLLIPVVVGISYELIKYAGRHDNVLTRIISAPGLWLQRMTTQEPDDSMIEVAIAAVTPVLPENRTEDQW